MKPSLPRAAWLEAALLALFAAAWRLPGMVQEWAGDELYQALAARQYLVDGTLSIAGGEPYERGRALTLLVAALYRTLGESALVARLPALVCGSLAVALLFLWLRAYGERLAAWVAAVLFAIDPQSVQHSQMLRFYTPQLLLFLSGAVCVDAVAGRRRGPLPTCALGLAALASLYAAYQMQMVTAIGIAGLGVFAAVAAGPDLAANARAGWPGRVLLLGVFAGCAVAAAALARSGFFGDVAHFTSYVDFWAREWEKDHGYYAGKLLDAWPGLWAGFAVAALLAASRQLRPTLLSLSVFGTAFAVQSLLPWKAQRYLFYAMPFFFAVIGLAIARVAGPLAELVGALLDRSAALRERPGLSRALRDAVLAGVVGFAALSHPALIRSARGLLLDPTLRHPGQGDISLSWSRAAAVLRPLAEEAGTVVATDDLKALYYLGRLDYVLDRDHLYEDRTPELGPRPEFSIDTKIDRPMVSEPSSIARIMACSETGLVVAQQFALDTPYFVPRQTRAFLLEHGEPVALAPEWGLVALRWRTPREGLARDCPPKADPDRLDAGAAQEAP